MPQNQHNDTADHRCTEPIALVVHERHAIHQVRDRGYVERPARMDTLLASLEPSGLFQRCPARAFADEHLTAVHAIELVHYLRHACEEQPAGQALYPYIWPIRNQNRLPKERSALAGYYCMDTFTPIQRNAYLAARHAVDCALTAADEVLCGRRCAYALVRPPGHHAEERLFGGFCYLNNTAVAAHYLSRHGKVAILDIDYHHGNGQQAIFFRRNDVLTCSLHGHPEFAYPYFAGFEDERGQGQGQGFNWNLPLPETVDGRQYAQALEKAVARIQAFQPQFLVVALGFDTAKGDPAGSWSLLAKDFATNGRLIGQLGLPTLLVQEGGYRLRTLGINALKFFQGLAAADSRVALDPHAVAAQAAPAAAMDLRWRYAPQPEDAQGIRELVALTGFFNPEEIDVAEELVLERLAKGEASGYYFVFAEQQGRTVGYSCYGPIAGSANSFDLYWIAVSPEIQRQGLGRRLMQESERLIHAAGGRRVYVETSQRADYASTRSFYENCRYTLEAMLEDFYAPGDGKAIYCKVLSMKAAH